MLSLPDLEKYLTSIIHGKVSFCYNGGTCFGVMTLIISEN